MRNSFVVKTEVSISNEFKKIIQGGKYEQIILDIMNSSQKLFPSKYRHQQKQSHGECDFVDVTSGKKYDAKLPFCKRHGKLLANNNGDYEAWLKTMLDESSEFNNVAKRRGVIKAESLTLYKIIGDRLSTINNDENLILFFPFPVVPCDVHDSVLMQFAANILTFVFDALEENNLVNDRQIFAIYPCANNLLAIRLLNKKLCEYVSDAPLKKYINYDISLHFE